MDPVIVYKARTNILPVSLGYDVSGDVISSQIRADKSHTSELIATWTVTFDTDGTDGEIILTLDDSITASITKSKGYMDLKRTTSGEPVSVFDEPIEVLFKDVVTT